MTLPRTAAQVLSGHVRLEIRCIDRVLLTFRQPRLQYGQGIHGFFCHHRGNQFVSSALMLPMTERFAADIRHYIDARGLDLIHFATGQSKDQIARRYLAGHDGGEQILFAGVAQEKTRIWRTRQRRDAVTGKRYPWLCQEQAMVNHWYFYGFDADFGPFYIKFCGYFPYTGQIYLNGHEYAKRQCLKAGIGFTALHNAFGSASNPAAVQRICEGLTDQKIHRFAGKWLARLPHPFTREDEDADYCWQLSVQQAEFSTTQALDRPVCGLIFFEQLIRDNIDIGRPDKVSIVFDRKIRLRGKNPAPGTFRTQVITTGACPYLYLYYKKTQVKQYLKEGRALRTETTLNQPRDFGIGKELTNLAALAEVGYAANRRLLDAECISHDPADGAAALEAITSPVISTTCTHVPGMRFPDPRVQALLGACCALALRPAGFTSRDLRHYLGPQLGKTPEDMTSGQISYDLRRLRAHQIIERIPHSRAYQVTEDGLTIALFLTRLTQRVLIPGLAQLTSPGPPGRSRLRQADRAYRDALTDLARRASLAALRHLQLSPAVITSRHAPVISRHTRRNLTRNSRSLRGKITYRLRVVIAGICPLICRRLEVPAGTTMAGLHAIVQTLFGWSREHLHRFVIGGTEYGISYAGGPGFRDDARQVRLADLRLRERERFSYEYNFSAAWRVDLRVEQIVGAQPGRTYPRCTGGRRASPPEDWDGPWAFLERTQPHLVFDASMRAAEVIGRLLEADDHRDRADVGDCRQELAELAPLLTLERFDRRRCNQDLRGLAVAVDAAPEGSPE